MRSRTIAHVLDMSRESVVEDYEIINTELKKYSEKLFNKNTLVIANKMDLSESTDNLIKFKEAYPELEVIEISAATRKNIDKLIYKLYDLVIKNEKEDLYEDNEFEDYVLYKFKEEKPFKIIKDDNNVYRVTGNEIEKLLKKTRFNGPEAEIRFANKLKKMGIDEELEKIGVQEGDLVSILNLEFIYKRGL
jgi:GTP-binding protein